MSAITNSSRASRLRVRRREPDGRLKCPKIEHLDHAVRSLMSCGQPHLPILPRSRHRRVAVTEGSLRENVNKNGVRLWTDPSARAEAHTRMCISVSRALTWSEAKRLRPRPG